MNNYEQIKLYITPLSPVHIGTGEDYEPTNYVIEDGVLYGFSINDAIETLTAADKEQISIILAGNFDGAEQLTRIRSYLYRNKEKLIAAANHFVPVSNGVNSKYLENITSKSNTTNGDNATNNLAIEKTYCNAYNNKPVIPGSSIKGAIRTALLDSINNGRALKTEIVNARIKDRNTKFQKSLFGGQYETDPLRLISVADTQHVSANNIFTEIVYSVCLKKGFDEFGSIKKISEKDLKNSRPNQIKKVIVPWIISSLETSIMIQYIEDNIRKMTDKYNKPVAPQKSWDFSELVKICNHFYVEKMADEMRIMKAQEYASKEWQYIVDDCLNGKIAEKLEQGKAILLKVGRHSGAEAVTVNGVRQIYNIKSKKDEDYPTTLWFAADNEKQRKDLLPFGWILLETEQFNVSAEVLQKISAEKVVENTKLQQKAQAQIEQQKEKLQEILELQQQKQKAEQEQIKQEEEQKRLEQERLNSMSPLQQELYKLEREITDNYPVKLLQLLEQNHWESENEQKEVATIIKQKWHEENKWTPDFSGSNKQKLKQKERCIKIQKYLEENQ